MKTLLVCLTAGAMALTTAIAMESTATGTWEGSIDGHRAVTLHVAERGGKVSGDVIFYVLKDKDTGKPVEGTPEAIALREPVWDGRALRFSVESPDGETIRFEMPVTAAGTAMLKRLGDGLTVPLERVKQGGGGAIR